MKKLFVILFMLFIKGIFGDLSPIFCDGDSEVSDTIEKNPLFGVCLFTLSTFLFVLLIYKGGSPDSSIIEGGSAFVNASTQTPIMDNTIPIFIKMTPKIITVEEYAKMAKELADAKVYISELEAENILLAQQKENIAAVFQALGNYTEGLYVKYNLPYEELDTFLAKYPAGFNHKKWH